MRWQCQALAAVAGSGGFQGLPDSAARRAVMVLMPHLRAVSM